MDARPSTSPGVVQPSVVLMDVRMPVLDGVAATRQICSDPTLAGTRVLVLTTFDLDEYVYDALRAGASGFLLKDTRPRDLLHAIEVVAAGQAMLAPTTTRRLIREFAARRPHPPRADVLRGLTEREREVLTLVARGHSNNDIADQLVISPLTAKTHVRNVLHKARLPRPHRPHRARLRDRRHHSRRGHSPGPLHWPR